jgi:hypothetical protein
MFLKLSGLVGPTTKSTFFLSPFRNKSGDFEFKKLYQPGQYINSSEFIKNTYPIAESYFSLLKFVKPGY